MSGDFHTTVLDALRRGDRETRGRVLEHYAPWLRLLARREISGRIERRVDASDIVQQTMLEACRAFDAFRGVTEAELTAWLRRLLAHVIAHTLRRHLGAAARDLRREVPLEQAVDRSIADASRRLDGMAPAAGPSPSEHAMRREESVILAAALERLPEDYREVIVLRHIEGLSHNDIAARLGRSPGAARMLWVRALAQLKAELAGWKE